MPFLTLAFLLLLLSAAWLRFRDPLYPAFIQAGVWSFTFLAVLISTQSLGRQPSALFLILVLAGAGAFSLGGLIATWRFTPTHFRNTVSHSHLPPSWVLMGAVVAITIALPLVAIRARELAQEGPSAGFLFDIRFVLNSQAGGERDFGLLAYAMTAASFVAGAAMLQVLARPSRSMRIALLASIMIALVCAVLATGRTYVLRLLTVVLGIPLVLRRIRATEATIAFIAIGLFMFGAFAIALRKGASPEYTLIENIPLVWDSIVRYMIGPSFALDEMLASTPSPEFGANVLRTPVAVLAALHFDVTPEPLVQEFVFVPFPVNVYTVYQPYYLDGGVVAAILSQFVFGVGHGFLYRRASTVRPHPAYVMLYAMSLYPLTMQFFQDQYASLLSLWIQLLAFVLVAYRLLAIGTLRQAANLQSPLHGAH